MPADTEPTAAHHSTMGAPAHSSTGALAQSTSPHSRTSVPPIPEQDETRPNSTSSKTTQYSGTGDMADHYGLRWLFDDDNPTHLPIEQKVLQYRQRDLRHTKLYKAATNVFWTPPSRKRLIIARSDYQTRTMSKRDVSPLEPRQSEIKSAPVVAQSEKMEDPLEYKSWLAERKAFRANLENMGLNEAYLSKKPNKTPLEKSVLRKMIDDRTPKPKPVVIPEDPPYNLKLGDNIPRFRRPCPEAIIVIEEFLSRKKMRLVDLFRNVDKKKKWVVTREEFTDAVKKAGIPLTEMALEDLIVSLDIDMDNCIDYRELVKGMKDWKLQKKRDKQRLIAEQGVEALYTADTTTSSTPYDAPYPPSTDSRPITDGSETDMMTSQRTPSRASMDPNRLTPPEVDTSPDRMDMDSDEGMVSLRKRNRETIRNQKKKKKTMLPKTDFYDGRSMIKIGNVSIDNHCRPCTMVGETGIMVDRYRQDRLREYQRVVDVCEEFDVPLTHKLLAKVLLYPPEKPPSLLKRKLRQPGGPLVSSHQLRPPPPKDDHSIDGRHRGSRGGRGGPGGGPGADDEDDDDDEDARYRGRYKPRKNKPKKMYLSTGKAYISRKVDCWMTFEEYERLLSHAEDLQEYNGGCDESAFWPGQLLDRIRLCMPPYTGRHLPPPGVSTVFQQVTKTPKRAYPGYNNDLNLWPANGRYLVMGHHDPYKNKF